MFALARFAMTHHALEHQLQLLPLLLAQGRPLLEMRRAVLQQLLLLGWVQSLGCLAPLLQLGPPPNALRPCWGPMELRGPLPSHVPCSPWALNPSWPCSNAAGLTQGPSKAL